MSETKLYSYQTNKNETLEESLINCKEVLQDAVALLYSPQSCQFLRLTHQKFQYPNGEEKQAHELSDIFEARIFNEKCELRWLNRNNGKGEAVLLSESQQSMKAFSPHQTNPIHCDFLEQTYLLWGQKAKHQSHNQGWQTLSEARIGKLNIPCHQPLQEQQRVYLNTYEYLSNEFDQYGNYSIIEERLVKLKVK